MTLLTLIIANAVLAAAVVHGIVRLLHQGIHSDRRAHVERAGELRSLPTPSSDRIAA